MYVWSSHFACDLAGPRTRLDLDVFKIRSGGVRWRTWGVNISNRGNVSNVLHVCCNGCSVRCHVEVVMFSVTVNNIVS